MSASQALREKYDAQFAPGEPWMRHSNNMSDIGHECERYLFYAREKWNEAQAWSPSVIAMMEDGKIHERAVLDRLRESGLNMSQEQLPLYDKYTKLSGKIDSMLKIDDRWYVLEVKSVTSWVYDSISDLESIRDSKHHWVRRWYGQMQSYLHYDREAHDHSGRRQADGVFAVKDRQLRFDDNLGVKFVDVPYNPDYALELMLKAERVNRAIEAQVEPERVSLALGLCKTCRFRMTCLPDVSTGDGFELISDDTLVEMLERRAELEDAKREFDGLDKQIKESFKGKNVIVGDWELHAIQRHRKGYQVAEADYFETKITRVKEELKHDAA